MPVVELHDGRGIGSQTHVGFEHARATLERGAVERDAVRGRVVERGSGHHQRARLAEHVDETAHVPLDSHRSTTVSPIINAHTRRKLTATIPISSQIRFVDSTAAIPPMGGSGEKSKDETSSSSR